MRVITRAILGTLLILLTAATHVDSDREQLSRLVQELQGNPDDDSLREQVIKLALRVKPGIPIETRHDFVMGVTIVKTAQDAASQSLAIQSFNNVLKIAPWYGDAYYNLAIAQELAGHLDGAKASLHFFILTQPGANGVQDAQDRIAALDAKKAISALTQAKKDAADATDRKKYVWLLGQWDDVWTYQGIDRTFHGVMEFVQEGSTINGYRVEEEAPSGSVLRRPATGSPQIRVTLDASGQLKWEEPELANCNGGWRPIEVEVDPSYLQVTYRDPIEWGAGEAMCSVSFYAPHTLSRHF